MVFEPPDRENAFGHAMQQIEERLAAFRVAHRRDNLRRLVKQQVHQSLARLQEFARDLDVIARLVGLRSQFCNSCAVHSDQTRSNHLFRVAARGNSGARDNFLQAFFHWFVSVSLQFSG